MRGSTTICHSSAIATDARSAGLGGKTAFVGNTRGVDGRSVCLGDSERDTAAEHFVSGVVTNPADCGIAYKKLAACRNSLRSFRKSYRREDSDCGIGYDKFAAYQNGLGKFTNWYRLRDSVRFRCICDDCNAASGHIPGHRCPQKRLPQCPRGSRCGLPGGYEA